MARFNKYTEKEIGLVLINGLDKGEFIYNGNMLAVKLTAKDSVVMGNETLAISFGNAHVIFSRVMPGIDPGFYNLEVEAPDNVEYFRAFYTGSDFIEINRRYNIDLTSKRVIRIKNLKK